jgi:hypothetical protein
VNKGTQQRIVELRNELQAQKVASGMTNSQFLLPENNPVLSYDDNASLSGDSDIVARVRFRFTRKDGLTDPPLVNFAWNATYSPSFYDYARSYGWVFTGRDFSFFQIDDIDSYIGEVGDGYVDFYIDYTYFLRDALAPLSSISISIQCQAIANVYGELSVERLI